MKYLFKSLRLFALCAPLAFSQEVGAQSEEGALLYDTHCVTCHKNGVHLRSNRAKTYEALRAQVDRWRRNVSLPWGKEDIDAVTEYLNKMYYKFPDTRLEKS